MWTVRGIGKNINSPIIARFTLKEPTFKDIFKKKKIKVYKKNKYNKMAVGLSTENCGLIKMPIVDQILPEKLDELHEGDILQILPNGVINRLYDIMSTQNALFLTEKCNSCCVMCPQPQKNIDHANEVLQILSLLAPKEVKEICITGGEPTMSTFFVSVMRKLNKFPNCLPLVLTNGRRFSDFSYAKEVVRQAPFNTVYAIPLYSAIPMMHDSIVGVKGAFKETIEGIHNLTRFRIPVEIRIVLTKQTVSGLFELAEFIGWNLPMTVHVAIMGMELHGRADDNKDKIWIEPLEYMNVLHSTVKNLDYRGLNVSIYNLPLCLLHRSLWKYSIRSISDWKQGYVDECNQCTVKNKCAGFFTTSDKIPIGVHHI